MKYRILLYPSPHSYRTSDYAGAPRYVRMLASAAWAERVYVYPQEKRNDRKAPMAVDLPKSQPFTDACRRESNEPNTESLLTLSRLKRLPLRRVIPLSVLLLPGYFAEFCRLWRIFRPYQKICVAIHINAVGCEVAAIAAWAAGFRFIFGTVHNLPGLVNDRRCFLRYVVERLSFRACGYPIFPSRYCMEQWQKRVKISSEHRVIRHGVDLGDCALTSAQAREQLGVPASVLVFGVAARLHPLKGHAVLLDALRVILKQRRVFVVLAGDGPLLETLKMKSIEFGIHESVKYLGMCVDMPLFYRAIDVNILPSLSEGMGLSVVEAMHAGLPQIVSDAGGMAELVSESGGGVVFRSQDTHALVEAMLQMVHSEKRALLGDKAKKYASANLGLARMLDDTYSYYKSVLNANS